MHWAIWYHLYKACNFTKSNTRAWMFFTFFKLYKWYQIAQKITFSNGQVMKFVLVSFLLTVSKYSTANEINEEKVTFFLIHFMPLVFLYSPWKDQETSLVFWCFQEGGGDIERDQWNKKINDFLPMFNIQGRYYSSFISVCEQFFCTWVSIGFLLTLFLSFNFQQVNAGWVQFSLLIPLKTSCFQGNQKVTLKRKVLRIWLRSHRNKLAQERTTRKHQI